ncbi:MAG: hypothetical protein LBU32_18070 [Clostridiales bacterium]|nr:hypothetical protein [Clostridiales bacterium]
MKTHSDAPNEEELRKRPGRRPVPPAPAQADPGLSPVRRYWLNAGFPYMRSCLRDSSACFRF